MGDRMEELELKRKELLRRLTQLGEFRRGSIAAGARKCGKKNCACAQSGHAGHPRYLWSTTRGRRSEARTLRVGPELEKFTQEVDNYRVFLELTRELVEVNEKICELRPLREVEDEGELEALKKNCSGGLRGSGARDRQDGEPSFCRTAPDWEYGPGGDRAFTA
jgi:hypothetical protein